MSRDQTYFVVYKGLKSNRERSVQVEIKPFKPELEYLQGLVGGFIEHYIIDRDLDRDQIDMWIDDEGKLKQLEPTWALMYQGGLYDVIFGNCVFSKYNREGETLGLNQDEVNRVIQFLLSRDKAELMDKSGGTGQVVLVQGIGG